MVEAEKAQAEDNLNSVIEEHVNAEKAVLEEATEESVEEDSEQSSGE